MADKKPTKKTNLRKPKVQANAVGFIPPEDQLGERILMLRTRHSNLTHESLSALTKLADPAGVGISRTTIRGYELGNFKPGARELRILSKALQVSPSWLLLGETQQEIDPADGEQSEGASHAEIAQLAVAFSALPTAERNAIRTLTFNLLKYKLGEVDYRKIMGFTGDLGNVLGSSLTAEKGVGKEFIDQATPIAKDYWKGDKSDN